ncbi:uncharacterized protein LOC118200936 [Stegodyphus dumicola]|uniref:uncharacterized protein LOC118200936 n=1 Tax=Stegodyphus dumicola TaxID=202533 RepID=UPI0015B02CD8|nr:uncharacterized protein LOC118200936 [Stegodyphus dumicola]
MAQNNSDSGHYLSHKAVIKDSSMTTKVRPVFDASLMDENGNSLNACLEKGPNLIEMLPKRFIQFRQHAIGVTADIRKTFLQISLCARDRDFLKFLGGKIQKTEIVPTNCVRVRHSSVIPLGATFLTFECSTNLEERLD